MMVGGGVDEDLGPDEPRPVDEWPPPTSNLELTNKDGTSSRLLFLTVQYVGDEAGASFNTGLDSFAELEQRVVSPLDPNMGCTACYSPVYRPNSPIIPAPVSPTGGYLTTSSPPPATALAEPGMIVLSETCQFGTGDNYVVTAGGRMFAQDTVAGDDSKLLLLSTDPTHPTELVVAAGDTCEDQRVELLLSNGTIAYGIVESGDSTGTRVIQIPREYLVTARTQGNDLHIEDVSEQNKSIEDQGGNVQDENSHLRALYNTLKEQGLIIEPGELKLEGELNQGSQLIDTALLEQATLPVLGQSLNTATAVPGSSAPPVQKRFWCEECNVLLDKDCREHQVNRKIIDKAVPSRARATLPASYLAINQIPGTKREEYGVFARKSIPKRTQFGPIEGVIIKSEDVMLVQENPQLELTIETESGELRTLDVSNEHMSNWMRFVRMACVEKPPNLLLSQLGASLFFTTTRTIQPRQELLVWYSPAYAARRNLPADPPRPELPCSTCASKFKSYDELTSHVETHKTISKREENLTVNTLRRKNQALVALVKKDMTEGRDPSKWHECPICKKKFLRGYNLKRHIHLLHTRENKYHCKICHLGFSHSFNRLRHMRRAHPNSKEHKPAKNKGHRYESWTCAHCKLTFCSASILNLHTLVHAADNVEENMMSIPEDIQDVFQKPQDINCPQCSQKFSNKRKLASHVAEHGKTKEPTDRKFYCTQCGRNFLSSVRFQLHLEMHEEEERKPLQCHICFKRLLTKQALTCHLQIHECNVRWECPMCKENFGNKLALRTHIQSHAVGGFYHCPHCDKAFEEYSNIRKHIRVFHSVPKFVCQDCGKRFPTQDKLRMHLLKHSDHREFLCADCGKQFKRKDKLKEHMKRMHSGDKTDDIIIPDKFTENKILASKKKSWKLVVNSSDYQRYIYKCHSCMLGFKRRGMLVNHLANRHPDITPESVPELNLPILKTTRDYYCQYCDKIYKSSSKRKAHILKNHPGLELPMSNRQMGGVPDIPGLPNPTFSQTVGSITTTPHGCQWCHKQYASKAKLLQHQRKKHPTLLPPPEQTPPRPLKNLAPEENIEKSVKPPSKPKTAKHDDIIEGEPFPVALSTNLNLNPITLSSINLNQFQEYEIITTEDDAAGNSILIDTQSITKRSSMKNENLSSDLLSQAISEIGVSLSDLRAMSSDQYLKLLQSPSGLVVQDSIYTPYTAR